MKMTPNLTLCGILALLLQCLSTGVAANVGDRPPNVVLIVADDLGYGDLSSYGAEDLQTPNIDRLVSEGMRFDRFYANCPVCSPTRAAILTGRYPELVGVPGVIRTHDRNSWGYLSPDAKTLPTMLKRTGYNTALIGKWHLGLRPENHPTERGFDFFHGFLGDMMDDYYTHRRHGNNYMRRNKKQIDPEGHATDLFTEWARAYLKRQANSDTPFFLELCYNAPHTPIQPPEAWVEKVEQRQPDISDQRAKLVALIEHMDSGVGKVVDTLKATGAYANTLILFTSDNGGLLRVGADNGHLRGSKQEVYEGGIRVPMCAVWEGHIEPGSSSNKLALTMDLFPTICDAAQVPVQHKIDGHSLLPTLLDKGNKQPTEDRFLFWTRREGGNRYMGKTIWAVRHGPWKLLQNSPMESFELYNLKKDPQEQHDLSNSAGKRFNRLARALRAHIQEGGAVPWQKQESR